MHASIGIQRGRPQQARAALPSPPAAEDYVSKLVAIAEIARVVRKGGETLRDAKDKVRKRVDLAIKKGELRCGDVPFAVEPCRVTVPLM